ncbi:MAG: hypothetical protein ACLT0Y_02700 [Christensenellales bacterium]
MINSCTVTAESDRKTRRPSARRKRKIRRPRWWWRAATLSTQAKSFGCAAMWTRCWARATGRKLCAYWSARSTASGWTP